MSLEPLYLDIRMQNTSVFSLELFLAKFTSTITATVVVLLLLKVVLKKGFQRSQEIFSIFTHLGLLPLKNSNL